MSSFLATCLSKEFPSLLVHTSQSEVFQGIISVFEVDYFVRVEVERTRHQKVKLFADNQLRQVLEPYSSILARLSETCESAEDYLLNLRLLISRATAVTPVSEAGRKLPGSNLYRRLFDELNQVGWGCILSISEDLKEITFELVDAKGRKHLLRCVVTDDYPSQAPLCSIEAPVNFSFSWFKGSQPENDNIANIYWQCVQFIREQQEFAKEFVQKDSSR
ncbi:E3 ubiquitin-protein ligase FANCL [Galdieria sulphuraria]|uniref:E3 ubiquitin-protein ligase FANCL n=1 Tax=Galdieria sulphuraria TaxID=130081 RepID=M2XBG0_GALSU|nr:E3 ubiquitin-protein ligase FANCL [Galdieria sulphuraria]EME27237.1 E3 ubiquitin-protein ligase FANCL [Galdieria sulphuraria]|eukprot:XP_005703757.1 E3 ubiquitin-protein ligase FANCL [Galdieria sulphuraria]